MIKRKFSHNVEEFNDLVRVFPGYFSNVKYADKENRKIDSSFTPGMKQEILGVNRSKFPEYTVMPYEEPDGHSMKSIVLLEDSTVRFLDLKLEITQPYGTIITFLNNLEYGVAGKHFLQEFSYTKRAGLVGTGSKKFRVTATIKDKYTLDVMADDEESALLIANGVGMAEWDHPTIEPWLTDRRMIRHARWGNLDAMEIS